MDGVGEQAMKHGLEGFLHVACRVGDKSPHITEVDVVVVEAGNDCLTVLKLTLSRNTTSAARGGLPTGCRRTARTQRPQASVASFNKT